MKKSHKGARVLENYVFKSINRITRTDEQTKAYNDPMYDYISQVSSETINEVSHGMYS